MLDPQLKADWVAALRSGEYEQHAGNLQNLAGDRFCCLGVLRKISNGKVKEHTHYNGCASVTVLSPSCGMGFDVQAELATLNDTATPFCIIADIIEKHSQI